jgi:hypothetical protein
MSGRPVTVYRLTIMYPEGSQEPGWRPARWRAQEATLPVRGSLLSRRKDRGFRKWVRDREFRWPAERRFLSSSSAYERARLLRSYGAEVAVERSLPVEWPDTCFTEDTETYHLEDEGAWLEFDASGLPRDLTPVLLITDARALEHPVSWAAAATGPGKTGPAGQAGRQP